MIKQKDNIQTQWWYLLAFLGVSFTIKAILILAGASEKVRLQVYIWEWAIIIPSTMLAQFIFSKKTNKVHVGKHYQYIFVSQVTTMFLSFIFSTTDIFRSIFGLPSESETSSWEEWMIALILMAINFVILFLTKTIIWLIIKNNHKKHVKLQMENDDNLDIIEEFKEEKMVLDNEINSLKDVIVDLKIQLKKRDETIKQKEEKIIEINQSPEEVSEPEDEIKEQSDEKEDIETT